MRHEFTKSQKREMLKRSGKLCEAVGSLYAKETRCNADLAVGVEFDHIVADGLKRDRVTIDDGFAVCIPCHRFKTKDDVKKIAKAKRIEDKRSNISAPKMRLKSAAFHKPHKDDKYARLAAKQKAFNEKRKIGKTM